MLKKLSIIIVNYNSGEELIVCIKSIRRYLTNVSYEIIVVDNNSIDNSLGIVNTFDFEDIKVYNVDSYTPGKSLNFGVSKCSNDYILILSACMTLIIIANIENTNFILILT